MSSDPYSLAHHAQLMLDNPAWVELVRGLRRQLEAERDRMALDDPARVHVSIAQTMLNRFERRAHKLTEHGKVEQLNAANARRAAGSV